METRGTRVALGAWVALVLAFLYVPIADCGWGGRKDCLDFTAWQQAWTQITG